MKKLLKIYGFDTNEQYYDMISESEVNGQFSQAKDQFLALPRAERKECVKYFITHPYTQNRGLLFIDLI